MKKYTHSLDGKNPINIKRLESLDSNILNLLKNSYKKNNNQGSIINVTGKSLIESIKKNKGEDGVDLITYSFPCQDLSIAGSLHGFNQGMEEGSGTRSSLLWQIGRLLNELKKEHKLPKYLLLENVKNMVGKKHGPQYKKWLKKLTDLGYSTRTFKLNSKDYGIPQNRERVYALSILNYKNNKIKKDFDGVREISKDDMPDPILDKEGISLKLKDILKTDYRDNKYKNEAIDATPNRTPSRLKLFNFNRNLLESPKQYSRTVTTRQDRNPCAGIIKLNNTVLDNKNNKTKANFRLITNREAYLLMGFSEQDYDKVNDLGIISKAKKYQQAGNSIVVNTIYYVFRILWKDMLGGKDD